MTDVGKQFVDSVADSAKRLGVELEGNLQESRQYAAQRMLHLSTIVDEDGYADALKAETVNVALEVAGQVVESADAADREMVGAIGGALAMGARILAGGAV